MSNHRSLAADTVSIVDVAESLPCADETEVPCASTRQAPRDRMSCTRQPREETTDTRSYASAAQYQARSQADQTATEPMNVLADTTSYNAPANETAPERLKAAIPQRLMPQNEAEVGDHGRADHMSGSKHPREQCHDHMRTAMTESPRLPAGVLPHCAAPDPFSRQMLSNTQLQRITSSDSAAPLALGNRVLSSSRLNPRGEGRGDVISPRELVGGVQRHPDGASVNVANSVVGLAEPRAVSPDNHSHGSKSQGGRSAAAHRATAATDKPTGEAVLEGGALVRLSDTQRVVSPKEAIVTLRHQVPDLVSLNAPNSVGGTAEPRCNSADGQSQVTKSDRAAEHSQLAAGCSSLLGVPKPRNNTIEDEASGAEPRAAPSTIGIAAGSPQEMRAPGSAPVPSESDYTGTACDTNPTRGPPVQREEAPAHGARPPKPPLSGGIRPISTTTKAGAQELAVQISSPAFSVNTSVANAAGAPAAAAPEAQALSISPSIAAAQGPEPALAEELQPAVTRRITRSLTAARSSSHATGAGSRRKRTESSGSKNKRPKH